MLKVGHLIFVTVVKALPDRDAYLTLVCGTELLAILPKEYADKQYKVGDTTPASVFMFVPGKIVLSQKSPQYLRKIAEFAFAPLLQEGKVQVKRAATVSGGAFSKIAVKGLNGEDPVKLCLPYLNEIKKYIQRTVTLVKYSDDIEEFIINALAPAPMGAIRKVIFFKESEKAYVYVEQAQVGIFFGKSGANVATAAKLTGMGIEIKPSPG